jgi:chromosomal replication initiator protein
VDVLLADDIQFTPARKARRTSSFTFQRALYDAQKQIVISSDCPPHEHLSRNA